MTSFLVTGAAGFVGNNICRQLRETFPNAKIIGLDNLVRPGSALNVATLKSIDVHFHHGDIRNTSDLESIPDVDWVIDAAANASVLAGVDGKTSSRQLIEHNLQGTINMLEFCKRSNAGFILLSTSRVYSIRPASELKVAVENNAFAPCPDQAFCPGASVEGFSENFSTQPPVSLYGSTKVASEYLALEYGETFDFPVWINRCGVMAGAGQFGHPAQGIFSYWIHAFREQSPLKYIGFGGKGHQVRDCIHPRDVAKLMIRQISEPSSSDKPRLVNVSGGTANSMSLRQLTDWCAARFQPMDITSVPDDRKFDIPWMVLDNSLCQETWGWTPDTKIEDILEEIALHAEKQPQWLSISRG